MNSTYNYIINKYKLEQAKEIAIPNISRDELPILWQELGFKAGVEVGVDRGLYAEYICKMMPGVKYYGVDPWKAYDEYRDIKDQHYLNVNFLNSTKRLSQYNVELIRKSSLDAVKLFKPKSIDFVYIDGNHAYKYVLEDLEAWYKIVKKGGIVSGHDYLRRKHKDNPNVQIKPAVDKFVKDNKIKTLFFCDKAKDSSWFFVKEK